MIEIKNFLDCAEHLPEIAARIHAQWFADKPGHTAEGLLARMRLGSRTGVPIGLCSLPALTPPPATAISIGNASAREERCNSVAVPPLYLGEPQSLHCFRAMKWEGGGIHNPRSQKTFSHW
jgi:hypothetical protein